MRHNMMVSRTNLDVALMDPKYGVQNEAMRALVRCYERMGTPAALMCFSCRRVFTWSDGQDRASDLLPAAYVHIEREKLPPASAMVCHDCNNDAGLERALTETFQAEDIQKYTPTHTGGHA